MPLSSGSRRRGRQLAAGGGLLLVLLAAAAWGGKPFCLSRFHRALALQDLRSAETWLERAESLAVSDGDTSFGRARLSRRLSRPEDFAAALERARLAGVSPRKLQREVDLARAAAGDVRPLAEKLPGLLQAGEDLPEICDAYIGGCILKYQLGEAERVLRLWRDDFPDDPQPHFLLGRLSEHQSNLAAAEMSYREALQRSPRHAAAAFNLGRVLLARQQPEEALQWYRRAGDCLAEPQPALVGVARCQRELGQMDEARRTLDRAAARPEQRLVESYRLVGERSETALAQVAGEYGQLELAAERFDQAAEWLQRAVAANPYDWRTRYSYAAALRQLGRKAEADEQTRHAEESREAVASCDQMIGSLQQNPADVEARYRIGTVLLKHISPNQGLVWLNSVLTYAPQHGPTHRALAEYYAAHTDENSDYAELARRHEQAAQTAEAADDRRP